MVNKFMISFVVAFISIMAISLPTWVLWNLADLSNFFGLKNNITLAQTISLCFCVRLVLIFSKQGS